MTRQEFYSEFLRKVEDDPSESDFFVKYLRTVVDSFYDMQQQITNLQEQVDDLSTTIVHLRNS